jgi:hypothetical protein
LFADGWHAWRRGGELLVASYVANAVESLERSRLELLLKRKMLRLSMDQSAASPGKHVKVSFGLHSNGTVTCTAWNARKAKSVKLRQVEYMIYAYLSLHDSHRQAVACRWSLVALAPDSGKKWVRHMAGFVFASFFAKHFIFSASNFSLVYTATY